jgi:predicted nucleic acid-binding protein
MILVDSNVIIDVLTQDPRWRRWSQAALIDAADRDEIAINPIIYAEITSGFGTMAELDHYLGADSFRRLALPYAAGFVAGRAFVEYRRRRGVRTSPLADFYIGAMRPWRASSSSLVTPGATRATSQRVADFTGLIPPADDDADLGRAGPASI